MARIYLLYHFFHPDDVISARLFGDLGRFLVGKGFDVVAMPCNRSCHDQHVSLKCRESWNGIRIFRVFRPSMSQHRVGGRLINSLFMLMGWTWRALWLRRRSGEVMIIGTDPVLAVLITIPWRLLRPHARIVHWCHDVYPDAAVADGLLKEGTWLLRVIRLVIAFAYRRCDVIADLGPCMKSRLQAVTNQSSGSDPHVTLTPWALVEPEQLPIADQRTRENLFGDRNSLGLLYSGNMGRAHDHELVLKLMKMLETEPISACFAGRGAGIDVIRSQVAEGKSSNTRIAGFANESELLMRLTAADVHIVTLRPVWTGTVIPSKFFGALAVGRPVLFVGSEHSAIATWIRRYQLGWVLTEHNLPEIAAELASVAAHEETLRDYQIRCHNIYRDRFCRTVQFGLWQSVVTGDLQLQGIEKG